MLTPSSGLTPSFNDMQQLPDLNLNLGSSPLSLGTFQQPFVPQDLWQMPMTLEWDWAEMASLAYPPLDLVDAQQNQQQPQPPAQGDQS
jgi:hypothetical protein